MRNKTKDRLECGARGAAVIIVVAAVLMFGSVLIFAGSVATDDVDNRQVFCRIFIPGGDGSMTGTKPLEDLTSFLVSIPAVIAGNTADHQRPDQRPLGITPFPANDCARDLQPRTLAAISPRKASEFTLVGAKPSGTG